MTDSEGVWVGWKSAHISLKHIAANGGQIVRQSPLSRVKKCIVAYMNVRGYGEGGKQGMIGRGITDKKLDICALSETKMKGSGEFQSGSVISVKA
jgi:hypothetical protein